MIKEVKSPDRYIKGTVDSKRHSSRTFGETSRRKNLSSNIGLGLSFLVIITMIGWGKRFSQSDEKKGRVRRVKLPWKSGMGENKEKNPHHGEEGCSHQTQKQYAYQKGGGKKKSSAHFRAGKKSKEKGTRKPDSSEKRKEEL